MSLRIHSRPKPAVEGYRHVVPEYKPLRSRDGLGSLPVSRPARSAVIDVAIHLGVMAKWHRATGCAHRQSRLIASGRTDRGPIVEREDNGPVNRGEHLVIAHRHLDCQR